MSIHRLFVIFALAGSAAFAQIAGMGNLRDPRNPEDHQPGLGAIQPWLAVTGVYDTNLDTPAGANYGISRGVSLGGGISLAKSYRRTTVVLGYSGSGNNYFGGSANANRDWTTSNVASLAVSTQLSKRVTFDVAESGGAANGGYGATSAGLGLSGLGVLGSLGLSSGFLFGGSNGVPGNGNGYDPLQNNLVNADFYSQMTYFSSTSSSIGFLLSKRTQMNFGGSFSAVRRDGRSFSDINSYGGNAMLSTYFTQRITGFAGYTYNTINYIGSIGKTDIQGAFVGISAKLSRRDSIHLSGSGTFLDSSFAATVALPPDVAALLGTTTATSIQNVKRQIAGGSIGYTHTFKRGGFSLNCSSSVAPGNDLILLSRSESCMGALSGSLSRRLSVSGVGGITRLNGMAQAGSRYDVYSGGLNFGFALFRGLNLSAGSTYRRSQVKATVYDQSGIGASVGLYWSPPNGVHLF